MYLLFEIVIYVFVWSSINKFHKKLNSQLSDLSGLVGDGHGSVVEVRRGFAEEDEMQEGVDNVAVDVDELGPMLQKFSRHHTDKVALYLSGDLSFLIVLICRCKQIADIKLNCLDLNSSNKIEL